MIKSSIEQQRLIPIQGDAFDSYCKAFDFDDSIPGWPDLFGDHLKQYLKKEMSKPIPTLSLFSGAGGLDIGFHDCNFEIIESVEIEEKFSATLKYNAQPDHEFSGSIVNSIDIREYDPQHLVGKIDFIIGGPPCQTFSAAGRRANGVLGTDDARGVLFREYVRILKLLQPKGFLFENVYGIVGAQNGKPWAEILNEFSKIGYTLHYRIVDAADYGVPQHRERLIIVGLKTGKYLFPRPTHGPDSLDDRPFYSAKSAIADLSDEVPEEMKFIPGKYAGLLEGIPPGLNYSFYTEEMGHPTPIFAWRSKFSDFLYKADPDVPVRTIKAQGGQWTGPLHWENRHFTINEFKRLQTFPDDYFITGDSATVIHQIGNSVPPQMGRILALSILNQVFNVELPINISTLGPEEPLSFRQRKRELTERYQQKARNAIKDLTPKVNLIHKRSEYAAAIKPNFAVDFTSDAPDYTISIDWNDTVEVSLSNNNQHNPKLVYSISIEPVKKWTLGVNKIHINCYSEDELAYPLCWKAVENELKCRKIKDDLVQLNGYYQYVPKIKCTFEGNDDGLNKVLKVVVSGKVIRQIMSTEDLAKILDIPPNKVLDVAKQLKKRGYEIRNHNTNPQIEENNWLIPYAFPTLTNLSVQLNKSLE